MSENRRMTSIARRFGRSWVLRLFFVFLALDVAVAALSLGGFCYWAEISERGAFTWDIERALVIDEGGMPGALRSARYRFTGADGEMVETPLGAFAAIGLNLMAVLAALETVMMLFEYGAFKRRAARLLRPLRQMTQTAQRLSGVRFDQTRFQHLEDAIASLSPSAPDAFLSTGDRELKGLEQAINSLIARMRDAYREQMRFVSDASHELRTPIAVIQGYSGMLVRWGKRDEQVLDEGLAAIKTEAENMNRLVEQLLFLARGDSGRTELKFEPVDLGALMREVYEEYRMIDRTHKFMLKLEQEARCVGDAALIKQAARILIDNAVKYTPGDGRITLGAGRDGLSRFWVQDNGIGIGADDVPRIFERFFRADPARARSTGGTGLGLSIAKWIVDSHGGYFKVLSREGMGTRISVYLPDQDGTDGAQADPQPDLAGKSKRRSEKNENRT